MPSFALKHGYTALPFIPDGTYDRDRAIGEVRFEECVCGGRRATKIPASRI